LAVVAGLWCIVFVFNLTKPLPDGVSVTGPPRDAAGMEFLVDLTYQTPAGEVVQQEIFDRVLAMIDGAEDFVVIDMFLFNDLHSGDREYRPLSEELTQHLIARKTERPELVATFITDEINNFYGAYTAPHLVAMEEAGIQVVTTNMMRLRDSNPAYSAVWRMALGWFGTGGPGWLSNIFGPRGPRVTVRGLLRLLNMKANHRKLLITDRGCLVASANPHDASSFHSNIAFAGVGPVCADLLEAERAVAAFSGGDVSGWPTFVRTGGEGEAGQNPGGGPVAPEGTAVAQAGTVQLLTEGKILDAFLADVGAAGPGDRVDLAMFYLAERQVVKALLEADARGAEVRLVLDPNKDAFGREKGGVPNRQVARELVTESEGRIQVRWYDTHGEQFHTKLVMVTRGDSVVVLGGSANLTRRNIDDYNLEADLRFALPTGDSLAQETQAYFVGIFTNEGGDYTLPFDAYRDDGLLKRLMYRFQEFTGLSSF
jgi:hypothetical protein